MGGIQTDTYGETGIFGLFAAGETACTGVHGANRLASNSLLEGIVFGQRIIDNIESILYRRKIQVKDLIDNFDHSWTLSPSPQGLDPGGVKGILQGIMWDNVGIIRNEERLKRAHNEVESIYNRLGPGDDPVTYFEVVNMLTTARIIIQAALWRKESRGGHFRSDYPQRDDIRWVRHMAFANW
jgi:L-aspartate oxidase